MSSEPTTPGASGTATATRRGLPDLLTPEAVLTNTAADLTTRFSGVFSRETVERVVFESYTALRRTSKVTNHLTSLARRFAIERLTALAQAKGALAKDVLEVLLVCEHNAGRSQLAAALLDHHAQGRVHVRSAGSAPAPEIDPDVMAVLAEVDLEPTTEFPKPLTDDVVRAADVVITMGCGDACPVYPDTRYADWDLPDPHDQSIDQVRSLRDELDQRVQQLLDELLSPAGSTTHKA